jgi:peptidoglycan/LPS O-acetylase OafA/YrhL
MWGVSAVTRTVLTPFQLDALCLGAFFAVLVRQPGGEVAARRAIVPMTVTVVALAMSQFGLHRFTDFGLSFMRPLRLGLFRVLFSALLVHALFAPGGSWTARAFRSRFMVALGKYSYGLYVYHHFFSSYFVRHGTEFALARVVGSHTLAVAIQATVGMAASMAVAWLSYELFEKRFLQLKRFWPSRKDTTVLATAMNAP